MPNIPAFYRYLLKNTPPAPKPKTAEEEEFLANFYRNYASRDVHPRIEHMANQMFDSEHFKKVQAQAIEEIKEGEMKTVKLTDAEYDAVAEILSEARNEIIPGEVGIVEECHYCWEEYDHDEGTGPLVHRDDCVGEAVVAKFPQED